MKLAFEDCADAYEQFRPGYPETLFAYLEERFGLGPGSVAVDVGAGTGRASALLAARGYSVHAVEPSPGMRARGAPLEDRYPGLLRFVDGTAEETTLDEGVADLLVAAQMFHWVDPARALPEAARVLKPMAGLALFWNSRDREHNPIAADLEALVARFNPGHDPDYRRRPWLDVVESSGLFAAAEHVELFQSVEMTADALSGLFSSISYVRGALDEAGFEAFDRQLRAVVDRRYGSAPFPLVYRIDLYAAERI